MLVIHPATGVVASPVWHPDKLHVRPPSPGEPVSPAGAPPELVNAFCEKRDRISITITAEKTASKFFYMNKGV